MSNSEALRINMAVQLVQKEIRRYIVRTRIETLRNAVDHIKAFMKMKWLSKAFQNMREAALRIQVI